MEEFNVACVYFNAVEGEFEAMRDFLVLGFDEMKLIMTFKGNNKLNVDTRKLEENWDRTAGVLHPRDAIAKRVLEMFSTDEGAALDDSFGESPPVSIIRSLFQYVFPGRFLPSSLS